MKSLKADGWLLLLVTGAVGCLCIGFILQMNQFVIGLGVTLAVIAGFGGLVYLFKIMRENSHCYNVFFDYQRGKYFDRVVGIADEYYEFEFNPTNFSDDRRFCHAIDSINETERNQASAVGKVWVDLDPATIFTDAKTIATLSDCLKDHTLVKFKFKKPVQFRDGKNEFETMLCFIRRSKIVTELPRSDVSDEGEIYGLGRWTVLASSCGVEEIGRINAVIPVCKMLYSRADLQESADATVAKYDPNNAVIKAGIAYCQDLRTAETVGEAKLVAMDEEKKSMEENWAHEVQRNKMQSGGAAASIAQANAPPLIALPAYNWKYVVGLVVGVVLTVIFML